MSEDTRPRRIQLKRTKGWKLPPNTVKVDRSTKWGNPYYGDDGSVPQYVSWFRTDLVAEIESEAPREPDHPWCQHFWRIKQDISELRGKNLACWCPLDQPCHADVLLEIANV